MARTALILTFLQFGASAASFVQQVFIARVIGATEQTDGYQIALALILFIAQGLLAGALVNAYVPRLASLAREDAARSRTYAFWAQANILAVASLLAAILWITTPALVWVTVAGLSQAAGVWAIESLRVMVLAIPIAALSGVYSSSLYVVGDLAFVAVAQITQNAVAAVFSVVGYSAIGFDAFPMSYVIGTAAGCLLLLARLQRRSLLPKRTRSHPRVPTGAILMALTGPVAVPILGAVPGFVERWFMSFFPVGQIALLAYAGRVFSVAIAFGVSVGVVALARWSSDDVDQAPGREGTATSRSAVKAVVFTTLPAAIALLLIPDVAVRLLFGDSEIDVGQLSIMSTVLSIYSLSLLPMALVGVVMRRFYAMSDATSALKLTGLWVVLWVVLDLILIPPFGIYGLAVAAVSAVWLALLSVLVVKRWEPWLAEWPAALLSRETLVISVSSVITVGIAAVVFRQFVVALAVASLPLIFAAYIVLSAIGGSSLARDVVRVATRPKDVS